MACNPVFLSPSISVEFTSLIVAVFRRISLQHTERIFSLSAIQFRVEKSDSIDFESMQRRTEIVFVVKLQTSHEISNRNAKTTLENLISEINTANIK